MSEQQPASPAESQEVGNQSSQHEIQLESASAASVIGVFLRLFTDLSVERIHALIDAAKKIVDALTPVVTLPAEKLQAIMDAIKAIVDIIAPLLPQPVALAEEELSGATVGEITAAMQADDQYAAFTAQALALADSEQLSLVRRGLIAQGLDYMAIFRFVVAALPLIARLKSGDLSALAELAKLVGDLLKTFAPAG